MNLARRHTLALPLALLLPAWGRAATPTVADDTWPDPARQRELPVRVRWPAADGPAPAGGWPVVLFSHGLGGSREGGTAWGEAWAAAGFVVVHLQHPGSDGPAVREGRGALRRAMAPEQLLARLQDVRFALDEIGRRQRAAAGPWAAVRADAVGMSGHSFGAHTTLGTAGQAWPGAAAMHEPRLAAFIAFSPSLPRGADPRAALAGVTRPLLTLTGTLDGDVVGNGATPENRAAVFDALPPGHKAQLLLQDADHMTFGGDTRQRRWQLAQPNPRARELQPQHHALVATLTTDWWRTHLLGDAQAARRLVRPAGLGPGDRWRTG